MNTFDPHRPLTRAEQTALTVVMRHGEARSSWRTNGTSGEIAADVAGSLILRGILAWHNTPHGLRIRPVGR